MKQRPLIVATLVILMISGARADAPADGFRLARLGAPDATPAAESASLPLDRQDVRLYQRIFRLQEAGDWAGADHLITQIGNPLLMGHVLYQRYMHPTAYRSRYDELEAWLELYNDHPGADRIHALATKRRPAGAPAPRRPLKGYLSGAGQDGQELIRVRHRSQKARSAAAAATVRAWRGRIEHVALSGAPDRAVAEFERQEIRRFADRVETDLARWSLARGYFEIGRDRDALAWGERAVEGSGRAVPEMHWTAGISAWRLGRIERAAHHFAALASAPRAHANERSRAAFWAARAHLVRGKAHLVGHYLGIAAAQSRDFYGLLARAVLGEPATYGWGEAGLEARLDLALARHPAARRAMALGQVGRLELAEDEIRKLAARADAELKTGLTAVAEALHLPDVEMRLAQSLGRANGRHHYGALFPVPRWQPAGGLRLDRALLFAIIRAESGFEPSTRSHVGAEGLMQVMPATARYIARISDLRAPGPGELFAPETSIAFGQTYLEHLLNHPGIGDNLIFVAAGYNAGPGRVREWQRELGVGSDPLLFLESIPITEPRVYVKKVLTNLWTYRARLGQPQPSLAALADNRWPRYQALEPKATLHAGN